MIDSPGLLLSVNQMGVIDSQVVIDSPGLLLTVNQVGLIRSSGGCHIVTVDQVVVVTVNQVVVDSIKCRDSQSSGG